MRKVLSIIFAAITAFNVFAISAYASSELRSSEITQPNDKYTPYRESKYFVFDIPSKFMDDEYYITPEQLGWYLSQMDKLYEAMAEFVRGSDGWLPKGGKILYNYDPDMNPQYHYASSYRGRNQINLSWYAAENIVYEISEGNVYWIAVHEMGHCFGEEPVFNTEFTADFLALYASVAAGIPLVDWHPRTGSTDGTLDTWYQVEFDWAAQDVDWTLPEYSPYDSRYGSILTCAIINFVRDNGWDSVKRAFGSYHDGSYPDSARKKYEGQSRAVNFNEFIDRIDYFGGVDFRSKYLSYGDWRETVEKEFPSVRIPAYKLGDVNGNRKIDIMDALEILKYLSNMKSRIIVGNDSWEAAKITGGTKLTIFDANEIFKKLAGMKSLIKW